MTWKQQKGFSEQKSKNEPDVNPEKTRQELELEQAYETCNPLQKQRDREELNSLMQDFLKKGGKIKKLHPLVHNELTNEQLRDTKWLFAKGHK